MLLMGGFPLLILFKLLYIIPIDDFNYTINFDNFSYFYFDLSIF